MKQCLNPDCDNTIARPDAKYCHQTCYRADIERQAFERQKCDTVKACPRCGRFFSKRAGQTVKKFIEQKNCSRRCSNGSRPPAQPTVVKKFPRPVINNWPAINPSSEAVKTFFNTSLSAAYEAMRAAHLKTAEGGNQNIYCLREFMWAEKAYAKYRERGLSYATPPGRGA